MDQKTAKLIETLKNNKALAQQLLQSDDGRQLLGMLTQGDGGASLEQAASAAARGSTKQLAQMLGGLMNTPQGAALLRRISEQAKQ